MHSNVHSKSGSKSKLACSYVQANHASSAKFLRSPALSTGQAIGASLLSLARCGGLWDYPKALKAGLLHPTATDPDQLGSPSRPYTTGTSAIWDSMDIHTPIDNYQHSPRPTPQSAPSSPSSPSDFPIFSFFQFSPDTRFEPPISVAHSEIPRQAQDTVEEKPPLAAGPPPQTPTRLLLVAHPPRPIYRILGRMIFLTVLLGGSLPGTNTAGNTEACPGQQWLTGTVEEGNLLCVNQPVAHRMCDFLQISVRVYRAMLWKHHKSNLSHIPDI
ncbi:hypothetical protein BASA61_008761 [Batrachochytrium salamandrivorans]|nr:hypothetical protein BASA61_008761 [Batrachochytrium salamandrivorans]